MKPTHFLQKSIAAVFVAFYVLMQQQIAFAQPLVGAQVWIEPNQTKAEIESYFKTLADHKMPVARLFVMWNFIETSPENYNYTLYDWAFDAAAKYNIKIVATLTTNQVPPHADKFMFYKWQEGVMPKTAQQMQLADAYIEKIVTRYRTHPALDSWMLHNEPGQLTFDDELGIAKYKEWLKKQYNNDIEKLNAAWATGFKSFEEIEYNKIWEKGGGFSAPQSYYDWQNFGKEHLTWWLQHIATQIRKYDNKAGIHVNPHAIFDILHKYELPKWRSFLTSLGASIHPVWHFNLLKREQFALGVAAVSDMIRGNSEPNPFWITELQGGNNIFSGFRPLTPTADEITRWVWTGIGSGAKRVIFWCLNWRNAGGEAGEWTMLDFQGNPTDRLKAASQVASAMQTQKDFFENAKPFNTNITILVSPESMTTFWRKDIPNETAGRSASAHFQSVLGFYRALSELGLQVNIKDINDFDYAQKTNTPQVLILPNAITITKQQATLLEAFVSAGHKLIVTGMTGFFDEKEVSATANGFPLQKLLGGTLKEVRYQADNFDFKLNDITLPSHLFYSYVQPQATAQVIGTENGTPTALRNKFGKGESVWIPSLIDIGAWQGNGRNLAKWLQTELKTNIEKIPFRFKQMYANTLMRTLTANDKYATIICNTAEQEQSIALIAPFKKKATILEGKKEYWSNEKKTITLSAGKTAVIYWN